MNQRPVILLLREIRHDHAYLTELRLVTKLASMATAHANGLKRPHPNDEVDAAQKRPRSLNSSPAPQKNGIPSTSKPDINGAIMAARAKAATLAAQRQGAKVSSQGEKSAAAAPAPSAISSQVQDRIAQLKARAAEAKQNAMMSLPQPASAAVPVYQPSQYEDGISRARGGLDVGLHPALMGDSIQDPRSGKGRQAIQPKFATTMANRRTDSPLSSKQPKPKKQWDLSGPSFEEIKENPYFDASLPPQTTSTRGRVPRQLIFNQKGKHIAQAAALRRQAALEAMKKRIAAQSRKAGMIDDIETEKVFLVPEPPEIEWWDEGLLAGTSYSEIELPQGLKIDTPDSVVTAYVSLLF